MIPRRVYYALKPFIPRKVQLFLRRIFVRRKLKEVGDIWPIDEKAGIKPPGWNGWPEGKQFALVLTHDVDTQRGHDRTLELAAMEKELGFLSSFNFVCRRYRISTELLHELRDNGFEIGNHGVYHDGKKFNSLEIFRERSRIINDFIEEWDVAGFRAPSMVMNLDWIHHLNIDYDCSTFDTDPFEPCPEGVGTIFPFFVPGGENGDIVELPYTLPQDFTLFVLMGEKSSRIWEEKVEWIARKGGMVLLNTHPDYMNFGKKRCGPEEYPAEIYREFLAGIKRKFEGRYWHVLPRELSTYVRALKKTGYHAGHPVERI
jgi:peptidoglycan/xylan/chitin deacetylase (PgdA/CDA1 family)